MVAAQIALEKLRQRDQLLKTENEMFKVEIFSSLKARTGGFFICFWILALLPLIFVDGES